MKILKSIDGRLVEVSTEFVNPPIPYRGSDYRAWYSNSTSDCPDCGWGRTREDAVQDLVDSYDAPDEPITFEYEYECDLIAERLQINAYEYLVYARAFIAYKEAK